MTRRISKSTRRRGFTLPEILMSLAIMGFVSVGLYQFLIDTSLLMFMSTEKLEINNDIRNVTNQLANDAREANEYYIYDEYIEGGLIKADRIGEGGTGDCMVLIYQQPYDEDTGEPDFAGENYIDRIVVIYREKDDSDADSKGPVRTFSIDYEPATVKSGEPGNSAEELVNAYTGDSTRTIVELAKGLADQKLFYVITRESVMVRAEIFHGNLVKKVTNTYNFTISPRG